MRTHGMSTDCAGCRFWSEMIAMSEGLGPVQAMCLAEGGPMANKYTTGDDSCIGWRSGYLGPIDDPYEGEEARTEYIQDEGENALKASTGTVILGKESQ